MVSGGLGFAGTHLRRQIEAEGHEAIALDLAGEAALSVLNAKRMAACDPCSLPQRYTYGFKPDQ